MADYAEKVTEATDGTPLFYRDYLPEADAETGICVLCLHGLTRSSNDFAKLADKLSGTHRVVCPDLRGRGKSGYAKDPSTYTPVQYIKDLKILIAHAELTRFAVVGTSLGGIMAMTMAGTIRHKIAGAVMNDVGPEIDPKGIARIQGYVGQGGPVDSWEAAADAVRTINVDAFPHYSEEDWLAMTRLQYVQRGDQVVPNYDSDIRKPFEAGASAPATNMWPFFDALAGLPLLLIRGETSDILSARIADDMIRRHGSADYLEVAGIGHAPMLDEPGVAERISSFLRSIPTRQGVLGWLKARVDSVRTLGRITKALKQG